MQSYEDMAREMDALKDTDEEIEGLVPVKAKVAKEPRAVFSVRLSGAEMVELSEAATVSKVAIGDFMRTAALAAARGDTKVSREQLAQFVMAFSRLEEAARQLLTADPGTLPEPLRRKASSRSSIVR